MKSNAFRRLAQKVGIDIHRHHKTVDKLSWLKSLDIKTVIDVGANIGQFAEEIRDVLPDAYIYSFEPLKGCFDTLDRNMKNDRKFKAFHTALGEHPETVVMNKNQYAPSSSILEMDQRHKELFPHTQVSAPETITVRPLDSIAELQSSKLEKNILVKIDTQGFEDKVIKGSLEFLKETMVMIVETSFVSLYKEQPLFSDIYAILTGIGFRYKGALHQKLNPNNGEIIFEDSFFVKD